MGFVITGVQHNTALHKMIVVCDEAAVL